MYYSDPTARCALSGINREFNRLEKKARHIRELYEAGRLSDEELEQAHSQFRGIYRHVLDHVMQEEQP